jgi:NDP-sugar pyrophosphorylase family protein
MNQINKSPIDSLGYHFIDAKFLPKGKDEYYLRNDQNKNGISYRNLTAHEIETLVRNRNTSDNWNHILVSDAFAPELVVNCKFFGLVRIGKLEPYYLEFHNLRCPVGLYNSTIISSDLGDNVSIDNVNYLSHYIIGNDVIVVNVNELATTDNAKFGNGILKQGELESRRIWLEVRNENGGRGIMPFDGMLPGDAFLWSSFRDDDALQKKFKSFTEKKFDSNRGYYGKIGDRTVIKNCKIIKDAVIGSDAYLKGANKLKNLTINSSAESKTQIGEGCEMVNGIVDYGCRIFYGVKAVRFIMASNSQLKYGARLINSYLSNNSTISCCEVLNALIFPAHEQHHNNSFLCAALVMGQSNMAAGATIGSNHNSRSADGEIIAGRGFWPGLCVSLKHNSKFASFIIVAKSDYPAELNIPIPFSLVSNNVSKDELVIMPAYWFLYNMYALARNSWKYVDRDKRKDKPQLIEYDFLAPDSINEMIGAIKLIEKYAGRKLLSSKKNMDELEIPSGVFENSKRKTKLIKVSQAYNVFKEMIAYHASVQFVHFVEAGNFRNLEEALKNLPSKNKLTEWVNVGGQLIKKEELRKLITEINTGKIKDWDSIHGFYKTQGEIYVTDKLNHALAALNEIHGIDIKKATKTTIKKLLQQSVATKEWMVKNIHDARSKDYTNPFRKMVYENADEMDVVIGKLSDNSFINQEKEELKEYKRKIESLVKKFKLA